MTSKQQAAIGSKSLWPAWPPMRSIRASQQMISCAAAAPWCLRAQHHQCMPSLLLLLLLLL
jgi:hypothetical protein